MKSGMEKAGFVNVVEKRFKVPYGDWPRDPKLKDVGRWSLLGLDLGIAGFIMATFTRHLGVSKVTSLLTETGLSHGDLET